MSRGRKPKDPEMKALAGNPGKRPIEAPVDHFSEPVAADYSLDAPRSLPAEGKAAWRIMLPRLRDLGMLRPTDLGALEHYCWAKARHAIAGKTIRAKGMTYETATGYDRVRPEVGIMEKAERIMQAYEKALAMTSVSRIGAQSNLAGSRQPTLPGFETPQNRPSPNGNAHDPIGFIGGDTRH